jgi:tricorn protease
MRKLYPLVIVLFVFTLSSLAFGREARLVRYPSYSNGRIAFTYLGDIWTADDSGQNIQRLTVNWAWVK